MPNQFNSLALLVVVLAITPASRADDNPGNSALFTRLDANHDGQLATDEIAPEHQRLFKRLLRTGDTSSDGQLTAEEFAAALTPSRPEKPIEKEQDADFPGAKAARWLLLTLDANADSRLTEDEIPEDFTSTYERLVEEVDRDDDGILNPGEVNRGGPQIARVALQTVRRMEIDLDRELDRLVKKQGDRANRFDEAPDVRQAFSDPSNAREFFARLDENSDGYLQLAELPDPLRERLGRPFRRADADNDQRLSPEEFTTLARRLATVAGMFDRPRPDRKQPDSESNP